MNGSSRRTSQSSPSPLGHPFASHPLHSPSPTNATGLIPSIASRLRAIQAHNNNALGQAIAQLEAADDLQSELVNTRASYARLASDLRVAVDQNMNHSIELQRSREEVDSLNVKLRAAMEQMAMLESRVVTEDSASGTQDRDAQKQVDDLTASLASKNERIVELHDSLRVITEAAAAAPTAEFAPVENNALAVFAARMQGLDKWLSSELEASDREMKEKESRISALLADSVQGSTEGPDAQPHKLPAQSKNEIIELVKGFCKDSSTAKQQMVSQLVSLRPELENVLKFARASMLRTMALEAALAKITELRLQIAPPPSEVPANLTIPIEVATRLPETPQVTSITSTPTVSAQAQPRASSTRRPSAIQFPTALTTDTLTKSQPSTPSLSAFASPSGSPQLKRRRTITEESHTPGGLGPSDELHAFIPLVNTTYEIRPGESTPGGGGGVGRKQLVCRMCENRHKAQPDYPLTTFDYGRDDPIKVPPASGADATRVLVRPWVTHIQEMHQKLYTRFMENFERVKVKRLPVTAQ